MYSPEECIDIENKIKSKETLLPNGCYKWKDSIV